MFYNAPQTKRNPKGPDWTGTAMFEGKEIQISAWSDPKNNGRLNVKIGNKEQAAGYAQATMAPPPVAPQGYAQPVQRQAPAQYAQQGYAQQGYAPQGVAPQGYGQQQARPIDDHIPF